MQKERLTAFTDGVVAIIITIMVLELKAPHEPSWSALTGLAPVLLSYALSFVYVGIYWNNHHHMFQLVERVDGAILWANLHLLFWLSLIPFATNWLGDHPDAPAPTALYGASLLLPALAYWLLQHAIIRAQGPASPLKTAIGTDWKGKLSPVLYLIGIALVAIDVRLSDAIYVLVAAFWLIPDRRIARTLAAD